MRDGPVNADDERRAVLRIEYDGTPFCGWARQPGGGSVEDELLAAFARIGSTDVRMQCAGRTDAGVHASAQVVSATYRGPVPVERLVPALGQRLPPELSVLGAAPAPPGFDARRDAASRAYEYRVLARAPRSPLRARFVLHHPRALDLDLLDAAAALVLGQHDFSAFTPSRTAHRYFHRTVLESRWIERDDELVYQVRANAFLRHMVRVLVGTMLTVGRRDLPLSQLEQLIAGAPRSDAPATALPHGLCLVDVSFDAVPDRIVQARPA